MNSKPPTKYSKILWISATPPSTQQHAQISLLSHTTKKTQSPHIIIIPSCPLPISNSISPAITSLKEEGLSKIFADKKMTKSWYSKNLDIYKIPSIKIYSLETKIKNKRNSPSMRGRPSSTPNTSLFPQKMNPFPQTVLTLQLKNQ